MMFGMIPLSRDEKKLMHAFDHFDREFFKELENAPMEFKTDVLDKGECYVLRADLPGFEKEEIKLDVEDNSLTISAEHRTVNEAEQKQFIRRERRYGTYARKFDVSGIDAEKISAKYRNGVLELLLPKKGVQKPEKPQITIE